MVLYEPVTSSKTVESPPAVIDPATNELSVPESVTLVYEFSPLITAPV